MHPFHFHAFRLGELYERLSTALDLPKREAYQSLIDILGEFSQDNVVFMLNVIKEDMSDEQSAPPALDDPKVPIFGRSVTLSLEFGDVETRNIVKEWLLEQAKVVEKRTGEVVQDLIRKASKKSRPARSSKENGGYRDDT